MSSDGADSFLKRLLLPLGVALLVACLHGTALCPTVFLGDSGELAAAIVVDGVPHPPGYPLFMLMGKAANGLVPWGEPAWRIGWVVVGASSLAAGLWTEASRRLGASPFVAAMIAVVLATSVPFARQCTRVEVYSVQAALFAGTFLVAVLLRENPTSRRASAFWFLMGLSAAHHTTTLATIPGLLFLVGDNGRRRLRSWQSWCFAMAGPLLTLELLRRGSAQPLLDWGGIRDLPSLGRHVSATVYRSWLDWPTAESVGRLIGIAGALLPWPLWMVSCVGFVDRQVRATFPWVALGTVAAPGCLFAAAYGIPDIAPYLFVPVVAWSPAVGVGIETLSRNWPKPVKLASTLILATGVVVWTAYSRPQWDFSNAVAARELAIGKLDSCPQNAVLVSTGDNDHFPLLYAQVVLGRRTDVQMVNRDLLRHAWVDREPSFWYVHGLRRAGVPVAIPPTEPNPGRTWADDGALIELLEGEWGRRPWCTTFVRAMPAGSEDPLRINRWLAEQCVMVPRGLVVQVFRRGTSVDLPAALAFNQEFWDRTRLPSLAGVRADGEVTPDYVAQYYVAMLDWSAAVDDTYKGGNAEALRQRRRRWLSKP